MRFLGLYALLFTYLFACNKGGDVAEVESATAGSSKSSNSKPKRLHLFVVFREDYSPGSRIKVTDVKTDETFCVYTSPDGSDSSFSLISRQSSDSDAVTRELATLEPEDGSLFNRLYAQFGGLRATTDTTFENVSRPFPKPIVLEGDKELQSFERLKSAMLRNLSNRKFQYNYNGCHIYKYAWYEGASRYGDKYISSDGSWPKASYQYYINRIVYVHSVNSEGKPEIDTGILHSVDDNFVTIERIENYQPKKIPLQTVSVVNLASELTLVSQDYGLDQKTIFIKGARDK